MIGFHFDTKVFGSARRVVKFSSRHVSDIQKHGLNINVQAFGRFNQR